MALTLRRSRRLPEPIGQPGLGAAEKRTLAIGAVAAVATLAVFAIEVGRVWRRGSAPLPGESDKLIEPAATAVAETVEVALTGYQNVSSRQNALFNLFSSFVATFATARGITYVLREQDTVGPFRNLRVGRRHIHHFIPGIALAFASGGTAIATRNEDIEPMLAVPFGVGLGLTLDESALLLELEDVYWTERGLVSVQVTMAVMALLAAVALAANFLRRGEEAVLEHDGSLGPTSLGSGNGAHPGNGGHPGAR
jgi:hypothetical protein